uniref:Uncharacterized protein n=1 Tax=Anguilla anguilla TaxID=7936 RepID=A0A0E9TS82_ANGAN
MLLGLILSLLKRVFVWVYIEFMLSRIALTLLVQA